MYFTKYLLLDNTNKINDSIQFIYICWVQIWSMTLWYNEEKERQIRIAQLLYILDKICLMDVTFY